MHVCYIMLPKAMPLYTESPWLETWWFRNLNRPGTMV